MRLALLLTSVLIAVGGAACGSGSSSVPSSATPVSHIPTAVSNPPSSAPPASPASGAESLASVEARLDQMLASAARCSSDSECRSVAVGGKACGGPTGYRAYSSRLADPAAVEALARQEHELAMQAEREARRVSNCLMMADPGAHCEKQRCEIGMTAPIPARGGPSTR